MNALQAILTELDERNLAMKIGSLHDQTRMQYRYSKNTVDTMDEFRNDIGEYYNYHLSTCNTNGGKLSRAEASQAAKEIINNYYQRKTGGNFTSAYNDAHDGTNGGMRVILDMIADDFKMRSIERYIQDVFDRYVAPNSWEEKTTIIKQFINFCGPQLSSSIDRSNPERYAHDFQTLIRQYTEALRQTSNVLRRN